MAADRVRLSPVLWKSVQAWAVVWLSSMSRWLSSPPSSTRLTFVSLLTFFTPGRSPRPTQGHEGRQGGSSSQLNHQASSTVRAGPAGVQNFLVDVVCRCCWTDAKDPRPRQLESASSSVEGPLRQSRVVASAEIVPRIRRRRTCRQSSSSTQPPPAVIVALWLVGLLSSAGRQAG